MPDKAIEKVTQFSNTNFELGFVFSSVAESFQYISILCQTLHLDRGESS